MLVLSLQMTLARKGRLFLTSLAIILGTAFLSGTFIFSDTLNRTFDQLFTDVYKDVDAYVRSSNFVEVPFGGEQRARIPVSELDTVLRVPGVSDAVGAISAFARIIGKDGTPVGSDNGPPNFGGIVSERFTGLWNVDSGRLPSGPAEMMMDRASAKAGKFEIGDTVRVNAQSGSREFTLVGIATFGDVSSLGGASFALFDQPTASEFLLAPGYVDAFLIQGDGSLSDTELAAKITSALPASAKLETLTGAEISKEEQDQIGQALGFLSTFLTAFSLIALGIGCFVIYNVFSITAAQRLRENALLRAIGASRRQVTSALLVESMVIGFLGSALGFVTGIGLSRGLSALLNVVGVDIPSSGLSIESRTVLITIITGVLVTVLSATIPAWRAGRVPPLAALRDTAIESIGSNQKRFAIGLVVLGLGIAALIAAGAGADIVFLGFGVLFVFTGILVIGPGVAKPVALWLGGPIEKIRGVTGAMARQNAARNPKRTARTAAPVLIGVALVTAFTAFAASVKSEIRDTIGSQFRGDYAVSAPHNGFGGLSPTLVDELGTLPQVAQATGLGMATIKIDGKGEFVQTIDPSTTRGLFDLEMIRGNQQSLTTDGILVSESRVTSKKWTVGTQIDMVLVDGTEKKLVIQGTFRPSGFIGSYVVHRDVFAGTNNSRFDNVIYLKLEDGVNMTQAHDVLAAATTARGLGELQSRDEFIDSQSGQVNQILGLIYGLLALSVVIAIVGIVITLLLSVFERQREIGLLRAIGMTRSQVRTTVRWESVITSMFGAVVGVVLGIVMGVVLIAVLADDGISAFSLPVNGTVVILMLSFVIGVLAAIYPARRATKVEIMQAIATM
ncbi:MAG: FtsX-like permease family protein [Actinomycetota bacterium]